MESLGHMTVFTLCWLPLLLEISYFPPFFLDRKLHCYTPNLSVCLSVGLPVCLSLCLSVCLPACLSVCLYLCLCVYLSVVCLPACLSVCLSVCRSHHSFPGSLDWTVSDRYLSLPTDKTLATYIWIDATGQV